MDKSGEYDFGSLDEFESMPPEPLTKADLRELRVERLFEAYDRIVFTVICIGLTGLCAAALTVG